MIIFLMGVNYGWAASQELGSDIGAFFLGYQSHATITCGTL